MKYKKKSFDKFKLEDAVNFFNKGNFEKSKEIAAKFLKVDPLNASQLLGSIYLHEEDYVEALKYFDIAITFDKLQPTIRSNRALALMGLHKFEDALASVNLALSLNPSLPDALYNKSRVLHKMRRLKEAIFFIDQYLTTNQNSHFVWFLKGNLHGELKQFDQAIAAYNEALCFEPNHPDILVNLGMALSDNNMFEQSLVYFDRALSLRPNFWQALQNKAVSFDRIGKFNDARECVKKALLINPDAEDALLNLGIICQKLDLLDESLDSLNKLIKLNQSNPIYYFNRGVTFERLIKFDAAFADYEMALKLNSDPSFVNPRWNRALGLLCVGDLKRGWREYESRFDLQHMENMPFHRAFRHKIWDGDPLKIQGKRFMVLAEQGLGDTIQFSRYIKYLIELGAEVSLVIQKPLINLFKSFKYPVSLYHAEQVYPEFDFYCSLMSLPFLLEKRVDEISNDINYLRACPQKVNEWRIRLGPKQKSIKRVGLIWSGGFRATSPELWMVNRRRNIELQKLKRLKTVGVEFHSLQVGELPESELLSLYLQNWDGPQIVNHAQYLTDFTETAALLENLDLLISVDTSTPHLAGVLGRPVWLMNRFDTCWRWMLHRSDSPWYPSFRIFRQSSPGDWDSVVEEVKQALDTFVNDPS